MSDDAKPQGTVQIALRISPKLRERIKLAADSNNRSVNSELAATLEEKYPEISPFNEAISMIYRLTNETKTFREAKDYDAANKSAALALIVGEALVDSLTQNAPPAAVESEEGQRLQQVIRDLRESYDPETVRKSVEEMGIEPSYLKKFFESKKET